MTAAPRTLLALALVAALAGCAALPTRGEVHRGVEAGPNEGVGYVVADDPQPGDGPDGIVQGFQSAAVAGSSDDFTTARKFLTESSRSEWDPAAQVMIYDGSAPLTYTQPTEGTVELSATVVATVDSAGVYTAAAPGTSTDLTYQLTQDERGEWRISELPDGVLMSEVNFGTLYRASPLYFLTADGRALVPDLRWFPLRNIATYAVRGLMAGASEWLTPSVISAIPTGTELSFDSVTISGGVATVPLTPAVQSASADDRALLLAQINATLTALPQIQGVEVTVGDVPLEVAGSVPDLVLDPGVGRTLTVLTEDGMLATYTGAEVLPVDDGVDLSAFEPSAPTVAYDSRAQSVMLAGAGNLVTIPTAETESVTLVQGKTLVAPSYAPDGWIWTGERTNAGTLILARATGEVLEIPADPLAGLNVRALRVSRDGARVAVIVDADGAVQVMVHAITHDADGVPTGVGPGLRVARSLTDATDVVWVDEVTLAVLGVSQTARTVHEVQVGGRTTALPSVPDTVSIAAARGMRELYLATSSDQLYARSGNGWAVVAEGITDPTFPG